MRIYILTAALIFAIIVAIVFAPIKAIAFGICATQSIVLYILWRLDERQRADDKKHGTRLVEAGNAITDTLRLAFDNLKKLTNSGTKTQAKITEHENRLRRLEQYTQRNQKSNSPKPQTTFSPTEVREINPSRNREESENEDRNEDT